MLYWLKEREKATTISRAIIIAIKIKDNDANKIKIDDFLRSNIGYFDSINIFHLLVA